MMSENLSKDDLSDGQMSLMDHLIELRTRLLISIVIFIILFLVCLIRVGEPSTSIADQVYLFLQKPLAELLVERGGRMIFTGLHEGFFTQIKVAFFTSISVALPIILIQVWKFVAPGLYKNERNAMLPFMIATPFLFILGAATVYYLVIPLAWQFFLSFEINPGQGALPIEVEPRISEYLQAAGLEENQITNIIPENTTIIEWFNTIFLNIWEPLLIGCLILGLISSSITYFLIRLIWRISAIAKWGNRHKLK